MASPSYVINEQYLLSDVYARIENLCNQVEDGKVLKPSIIAKMKRFTLRVLTYASGTLSKEYRQTIDLTLVIGSPVTLGTVDLSSISTANYGKIIKIHSVSEPSASDIEAGEFGIYTENNNYDAFLRKGFNTELNTLTRQYFYFPKSLELRIGSGCTYKAASPEVRVVYMREPWTDYAEADVDDSSTYIDLPSIFIPFMENGTAYECLKEAGVKENKLTSLQDEMQASVKGLDDYIEQNNMRNLAQNTDD